MLDELGLCLIGAAMERGREGRELLGVALILEDLAHMIEHALVVAGAVLDRKDGSGQGRALRFGEVELLGGPVREKLVAARGHAEPELLVMGVFGFECARAVLEAGHGVTVFCVDRV